MPFIYCMMSIVNPATGISNFFESSSSELSDNILVNNGFSVEVHVVVSFPSLIYTKVTNEAHFLLKVLMPLVNVSMLVFNLLSSFVKALSSFFENCSSCINFVWVFFQVIEFLFNLCMFCVCTFLRFEGSSLNSLLFFIYLINYGLNGFSKALSYIFAFFLSCNERNLNKYN